MKDNGGCSGKGNEERIWVMYIVKNNIGGTKSGRQKTEIHQRVIRSELQFVSMAVKSRRFSLCVPILHE